MSGGAQAEAPSAHAGPLLSICIPTHHGRAEPLREALDSLLAQLDPGASLVEICISDNASNDGTQELVSEYRSRHGDLVRYGRNQRDLGMAGNILAAAELAGGRFCWLLGSDDAVVRGGVDAVLALLRDRPDLTGLSVNRVNLDYELRREVFRDPPQLLPERLTREARTYLDAREALNEIGLYMTYLPAQVFRRDQWLRVAGAAPSDLWSSVRYYPHLYVLSRMLVERPLWLWSPQRVVMNRTENDAALGDVGNRVHAYQIATMRDRSRVWSAAFGRESGSYRILAARSRAYWAGWATVAGYKLKRGHTVRSDWELVIGFTRELGRLPSFWLRSLPFLLIPHFFIKAAGRVRDAG